MHHWFLPATAIEQFRTLFDGGLVYTQECLVIPIPYNTFFLYKQSQVLYD